MCNDPPMPALTPMDEYFVHQIPEPLPNVATFHNHWRESLFFVMHPRNRLGDVLILTLAHYPARREMDSLQLGRVADQPTAAMHSRPYDGDPHTMAVGPVEVEITEPFREVHLKVANVPEAPVAMDITFLARTAPYAMRRGTMRAGHELIWDQSHMVQSGTYSGWYAHGGSRYEIDGFWGQRDHSWGIRDHSRCPLWIWLAIQLPDAMIALWHWELANGCPVYTDGCYAPTGGGQPISVTGVSHDLHWVDETGAEVGYGRDGSDVAGIAGRVEISLENGTTLGFEAAGRWAQRYGELGGGLNEVLVHTDNGVDGTAIFELTGAHHHRYFPIQRGERLPPEG